MVETTNMQVSRLFRVEKEGSKVKAFVDVCVADCLIVKGFKVVENAEGLFVGMPSEPGKDGKWYHTVLPVTKEKKEEISKVILEAYNG